MPASSFFGSLGELARHRNKKVSVEQEKQDRLTEQMRKMQIQGVKKQQDKYDQQKTYYDQIDGLIGAGKNKSGITSAMMMATQANMGVPTAKDMSAFTGKDVEMNIDHAAQYKQLKEQVNFFRKNNTRPELTPEDVEKIQARRGVDNLGFEKSIKNLLGIDASKDYYGTPLVGLKAIHRDTAAGVSFDEKVKAPKALQWQQKFITDAQTGKVRMVSTAITEDGKLIMGDSKIIKKPWKTDKGGGAKSGETKVSAEETRTIDSIARNAVQQKWQNQGGTDVLMSMFAEVMDPTTNRPRAGAINRGQSVLYSIYEGLKSEKPSANTGEIAALAVETMEILNDVGAFTNKPIEGSGWFGSNFNQDEFLEVAPTVSLWAKNPANGSWQEKTGIPIHRAGTAVKRGFTSFQKLPASAQQKIVERRGAR